MPHSRQGHQPANRGGNFVEPHDRPKGPHPPGPRSFLKRFENEVDPDRQLAPDERYRRAEHA